MDWSSVYEDEGEGQGDWAARGDGDREDEGSVRTKLIASFSARGQYTPLICYAFTVNYILGVGCLGIPYAFLQSGLVLGSVLLLVLSCISYITVMWVFAATQQEISISSYLALTNPFVLTPRSALARRKRYVKSLRHGGDASASAAASRGREESTPLLFSGGGAGNGLGQKVYASLSNLLAPSNASNTSNTSTAAHGISNASHGSASAGPATGRAGGGLQELEVVDLVRDFLGERARLAYQVSLMALTYIGLLAYAQVFAATFRQQLWPQASPAAAVALFALVVVPLSLCELQEQVGVQVCMAAARFLALGGLVAGMAGGLALDFEHSALHAYLHPSEAASLSAPSSAAPRDLWCAWPGFGSMLCTAIFSQLFQHSVPGLVRPLRAQDKALVPRVFLCALLTTTLLYWVVGVLGVLYLGSALRESVNLNFDLAALRWAEGPGEREGWRRALLSVLCQVIVLFPALDTLSVFPLIAVTLGTSLQTMSAGRGPEDAQKGRPDEDGAAGAQKDALQKPQEPRESAGGLLLSRRVRFRLLAALPPLLLSTLLTDLSLSLKLAGCCGVVVALLTPCLLRLAASRRVASLPPSLRAAPLLQAAGPRDRLCVLLVGGVGALALGVTLLQMLY